MPSQLGFFGPESLYDSGDVYDSRFINMYTGDDFPVNSKQFTGPTDPINRGPAYDTSMINMYLGDDPRPPIGVGPVQPKPPQGTSPIFNMGPDSFVNRPISSPVPYPSPNNPYADEPTVRPISNLTWDGATRGPESLLWLQGRIPDRNGNYHNPQQPLGPQRQFPNEEQLRQEYQEYMNSIGNPPTVSNDYFYWRADRLAGASAVPAGNKSIFSLGPESFIQMDAITEFQARQPKDVRLAGEGMLLSPHDLQNSKITAMAYQLAGITQVSGGRLSPEAEQKVSAGMQQALLLIQQKMAGGQSYDEAVESVYADQGAPPPAPRRGGGGDEPFKCATGCSSWHEKQCKKYGAPRGCDLDKAKKNHRDRNRTTYCPVPSD